MSLGVTVTDQRTGDSYELAGDSLQDLAEELRQHDYEGPHLTVFDDPGFVVGWIGADGYWRTS